MTLPVRSFDNFEQASRSVLAHLYRRFGFALWMVTRAEGDDWHILYTEDHGYDIAEGRSFRWSDSFCMRMVSGRAPQFAPRTTEIPAYVSAEIGHHIEIGAYIGMPLTKPDGSLFGTLCAIDPVEHAGLEQTDRDLIALLANLLSSVLERELQVIEQTRRETQVARHPERDDETGLLDSAGWRRVLTNEDARARRFGSPACVLAIELGSGDDATPKETRVGRVADMIGHMVRETDFVARVGERTLAVLMIECDQQGGARLCRMLRDELTATDRAASVGWAAREADTGLDGAWQRAWADAVGETAASAANPAPSE